MTLSEGGRPDGDRLDEYRALVAVGDDRGISITVWAQGYDEARAAVEAEHGERSVISLQNVRRSGLAR